MKKTVLEKYIIIIILCIMMCFLNGCGQKEIMEISDKQEMYCSEIHLIGSASEFAMNLECLDTSIYVSTNAYKESSRSIDGKIYQVDGQSFEAKNMLSSEIQHGLICAYTIKADGTLYTVSEKDDVYFMNTYNVKGEHIESINLSDKLPAIFLADIYVADWFIDDNKNIYFVGNDYSNGNSTLIKLTYSGESVYEKDFHGTIEQIAINKKGEVFAAYQNGENYLKFCRFSQDANRIDTLKNEFSCADRCVSLAFGNDENKLYFCTEDYFYEYDYQKETVVSIVSASDMELGKGRFEDCIQITDSSFALLYCEEVQEGCVNSLIILSKDITGNEELVKETKKELSIAVFEEDSILRGVVKEFNKTHPEYHLEIKKYNPDSDGIALLHADIAAGKVPDILDVANMNLNTYIEKNIIIDLGQYLDEDEELTRDDFLAPAVKSCSRDEKIYALPSVVWLGTLLGKSDNLNNMKQWNFDEFQNYLNTLEKPERLTMVSTKEEMFQRMISQCSNQFIEWDNATCNFAEDEFLRLLEFCNMFPLTRENYKDTDQVRLIREDELLVFPVIIKSIMGFQLNQAMAGSDITYIGYPVESGSGTHLIITSRVYAITEQCEEKDVAWEIIKLLCTNKEIGKEGFPTYKKQFVEDCQTSATKFYRMTETGERVETYTAQIDYYGEMLEIYALTAEEENVLKGLLENADEADMQKQKINEILVEEALPYFNGQKSIQEVVEVIQSRVQLYLDESCTNH